MLARRQALRRHGARAARVGWGAKTLEGGYKAYRRHVVDSLAKLPARFTFRVIHGVTGSGKSRLLRALDAAGAQVLDLEDLAAHRGSLLGSLPERPQPSQKMFESLLLQKLLSFDVEKGIFVEGESKKIGQLQVPEALMARMRASECLLLQSDYGDARGTADGRVPAFLHRRDESLACCWIALSACTAANGSANGKRLPPQETGPAGRAPA